MVARAKLNLTAAMDTSEFTPLPVLKRSSAKRTYAMFASESLDGLPENEAALVANW